MIVTSVELACYAFICLLPGIYVSLNKYFFYSPYPPCRHLLIRMYFLAPLVMSLSFVTSGAIYSLPLLFILGDAMQLPKTFPGLLILNLIYILILRQYVLPREEPEIFSRDWYDYRYFIFWPGKGEISDSQLFGTKYERAYKKRLPGQPPIYRQLSTLVLSNYEIKGKEIVLPLNGEIAVTQRFLDALTEKGATGYTTNPVKISFVKNSVRHEFFPPKDREPKLKDEDGREWFQLIAASVLPPLHPLTKHVVKDKFFWESVVVNSKFYYDEHICDAACDVNQTAEYFGSTASEGTSARPQRYWVFSARLKDLMIREFGFREMDFVPVRRVDKDGNVIDASKKESTAPSGAETVGAETVLQSGKV